MNVSSTFNGYWFNNGRPDGEKLDSSAAPVVLQINSNALWDALISAPSALQLIGCEVVGCKQQFLTHFVGGQLVPVPEMELERAELNEADRTLTVFVKRQLPLSSSHGGQPLQLAFAVAATGDVAFTEPFTVLAKQGRAGTHIKILRSKPFAPVNEERTRAREAIATVVANGGLESMSDLTGPAARAAAAAAGSALRRSKLDIDIPAIRSSSPAGALSGMVQPSSPATPAAALAFSLSRAAVSTSADTLANVKTSPRHAFRQLEEAHESPRSAKRSRTPQSPATAACIAVQQPAALVALPPPAPAPLSATVLATSGSSLPASGQAGAPETALHSTASTLPSLSVYDDCFASSGLLSFNFTSFFDGDLSLSDAADGMDPLKLSSEEGDSAGAPRPPPSPSFDF